MMHCLQRERAEEVLRRLDAKKEMTGMAAVKDLLLVGSRKTHLPVRFPSPTSLLFLLLLLHFCQRSTPAHEAASAFVQI
jgi:hypothetical protein